MTNRGPEAARDSRAASSWAGAIYSDTARFLASWCRLWSLAYSVLVVAAALLLVFAPGWDAAGALMILSAALAVHVWLGFFYLANPEWRRGSSDGDA